MPEQTEQFWGTILNSIQRQLAEMQATQTKIVQTLSTLVSLVTKEQAAMTQEFEALKAQVEATVGVEQSAIVAIQGIAAQIAALNGDAAGEKDLAQKLKDSAAALAAAIPANPTPAPAPAPSPAPAPNPAPPPTGP